MNASLNQNSSFIQWVRKNYKPEDSELLLQAYYARKAKHSLYYLATTLLDYDQMTLNTHTPIVEALESNIPRKLIVQPRGSFKSSVASIAYPIWRLINNPELRILIDSELYQNSKNFLREIKGHLESPKMITLFGEFKGEKDWTEKTITISQRTKNIKEASITCSGIGAEKTGQHYDIVIMDDLSSPKNSQTEEQRNKVKDHIRYMQSILEPNGTLVMVGTRYHAQDSIGFILETQLELANDGSSFDE